MELNENEILKYFKESIKNSSLSEINNLQKEIKESYNLKKEEIINELNKEKEEIIKIKNNDLDKKYKLLQADVEDENKKELVLLRNKYIDELFNNLNNKLIDYTKTKEYQNKIKDKLLKLKLNKNNISKIEISKNDLFLKDEYKDLNFEINNEILGGFIIYFIDNKIINETLNIKINDAKNYFFENAHWFIK